MSQYVDQRMQAWIGRTLVDRSGQRIGRVEDIYTDDVGGHPAWIAVATGRLGLNITFLPFAGATPAGGDELRVQFPKNLVRDAPIAGKGGRLTQEEVVRLYDHYGFDLEAEEVRERASNGRPSSLAPGGERPAFRHASPVATPGAARPEAPPQQAPRASLGPAHPLPPRPASPAAPPASAPPRRRPAPPATAQPAPPPPARPAPPTTAQPAPPPPARPAPPLRTALSERLAGPVVSEDPEIRPDSPLLWNHDDRIDSIRPPRQPASTGRR